MERLVFLVFLCAAVERHATEHIYVNQSMTWLQAQSYCRNHYTDLSYIRNGGDYKLLKEAAGGTIKDGWIGLQRNPNNASAWTWSGTGPCGYRKWGHNQPDNNGIEDNVKLYNGNWFDEDGTKSLNFYCFRMNSPDTRMNWEDAWTFCRKNRTKLFSPTHRLDRGMARNVFQKPFITEPVWIGLRYLGDRWFWMTNNTNMDRNWAPEDKDHMCPKEKRCGAFTRESKWVSWDCLDELNFICA